MPAMDITIKVQWTVNNYTVTFIFDNGAPPKMMVFQFNTTIVYPEISVKEGSPSTAGTDSFL